MGSTLERGAAADRDQRRGEARDPRPSASASNGAADRDRRAGALARADRRTRSQRSRSGSAGEVNAPPERLWGRARSTAARSGSAERTCSYINAGGAGFNGAAFGISGGMLSLEPRSAVFWCFNGAADRDQRRARTEPERCTPPASTEPLIGDQRREPGDSPAWRWSSSSLQRGAASGSAEGDLASVSGATCAKTLQRSR